MFSTEPGAGPWTRFPQVLLLGSSPGMGDSRAGTFRPGNLPVAGAHFHPDSFVGCTATGAGAGVAL